MIYIILWIRLSFVPGWAESSGVASWDDPQHPIWSCATGPEHKIEIYQKIVRDASRRVRAEGLHGAAVGTVMRDTGLTHGGFYKHFGSKDDLRAESLREAFREIEETLVRAA